ncbi:MAG: hypothetical protein ACAH88_19450 [Roseimicrobium sp.]
MTFVELSKGDFSAHREHQVSTLTSQSWDESLLHCEWKQIENAAYALLENGGLPSWDFTLMDWPSEIPYFFCVVNNRNLAESITLSRVHRWLQGLTLPWHIVLECYDNIHGKLMQLGDDLGEAMLTHEGGHYWRGPHHFPEEGQ